MKGYRGRVGGGYADESEFVCALKQLVQKQGRKAWYTRSLYLWL